MNAATVAEHAATRWYAIVDTAQDEGLYDYVQSCGEFQCFISGNVPRELATTLPYLVVLGDGEPFTEAWSREGLGKNWGIVFESWASIDDLRVHFKKFMNAQLPDGTVALFRFYDPRVFRTYFGAATNEERHPWFRLVTRYLVEAGALGSIHDFHTANNCFFDGRCLLNN